MRGSFRWESEMEMVYPLLGLVIAALGVLVGRRWRRWTDFTEGFKAGMHAVREAMKKLEE